MSKAFLKDLLRDRREGNFFFSAIKQEWTKLSLEKSQNFTWSGHINPSHSWMVWDGCPYDGIREAASGRDAREADSIQYMEVGNFFHEGFMKWALNIPGLLWPKPSFPTKQENDKLDRYWPEVAFYWDLYCLSGRIDAILNIKGEPAVVDLKIPQWSEDRWKKGKAKLPEDTHLCQAALGALALKHMGIMNPTRIGVLYFNPKINPKGDDGYKECYEPFTAEMEQKTLTLLQYAHKELVLFKDGQNNGCIYPGCKEHHGEKVA